MKQLCLWVSIIFAAGFVSLFLAGVMDDTSVIPIDNNCIMLFTDERPDVADTNIVVCIPAAFSDKNGIVGHYSTGKGRTGTTDYRYTTIHLDGKTHFQQASLTKNRNPKIYSDQRRRYRRALCLKNGRYSIVHSKRPVTLTDFSRQLTDYDRAWNLDMGTYAYGWYRDERGLHHLGLSTFWNKHKQTNWIVIKKK